MVRLNANSFVVFALACSVAAATEDSTCAADGGQECQTLGSQLRQKKAHKSEIKVSIEEVDDEEKQPAAVVQVLTEDPDALESLQLESSKKQSDRTKSGNLSEDGQVFQKSWVHHHIWKCGGSNLCEIARQNGETVPHSNDQGPTDRCDFDVRNVQTEALFDYSYVQIQSPFTAGALSRDNAMTTFSVMLREPISQTLSHFSHVQEFGDFHDLTLIEWMNLGQCRPQSGVSACLADLEVALFKRDLPAEIVSRVVNTFSKGTYFFWFEDNIQTRWLGPAVNGTVWGASAFYESAVKQGSLRESALVLAKARLNLYDHIFILEKFDDRDYARLQRKLGWADLIPKNKKQGTDHIEARNLSVSDLAAMCAYVKYDLDLYDYAKTLAVEQCFVEITESRLPMEA